MAIIPEIIIQDVLAKGLGELKRSPWKIHQIFRTAPQSFVQSYVELLKQTPIDIVMNYPREEAKFPCICIMLRGEQESHTLLNNFLSSGYGPEDLSSFGVEELFYTSDETSSDESLEGRIHGEPRRIFDTNDNTYLEQYGSGLSVSYLIQVMTDDQEFTVFLYATIKHILLANMLRFEKEGFLEINIGGTDFLPQTTHNPNFIFIRGITFSFMNFFDFFVDPNAEAALGVDGYDAIAKAVEIELIDCTSNVDKEYGTLAGIQRPQIRNLYGLAAIGHPAGFFNPAIYQQIGQNTYNITARSGARGGLVSNLIATGINLKRGAGFRITNGVGDTLTVVGQRSSPIFLSPAAGAAVSTVTRFNSTATTSVPSSVREGMFLSVIAPSTHGAFGEERVIASLVYGVAGTITVETAFSAELDGATVKVTSLDTSPQVEIIDEIQNVVFDSTLAGQSTSNTLEFRAAVSDTVSSNLLDGMYLQVVGPESHASYKETNRVISSTAGPGGEITVVTPFSSSLEDAFVRVIELQDFLRFSVFVPDDVTVGAYNVTVVNNDLLEDTLVGGFTVV